MPRRRRVIQLYPKAIFKEETITATNLETGVRKLKKIIPGISVFVLGLIVTFSLTILFSGGGTGGINASIFNTAIRGIIFSILFLAGVIVVCTLMIIDAIKNTGKSKNGCL